MPALPCSGWFEFLEEVRQQVGQVVLLTCPTERFGVPDRYATRRVVAQRNELLRQLVADSRGGSARSGAGSNGDAGSAGPAGGSGSSSSSSSNSSPFLLLDLDAMTKWLPREVALSPHDFHYQVSRHPECRQQQQQQQQQRRQRRRRMPCARGHLHSGPALPEQRTREGGC